MSRGEQALAQVRPNKSSSASDEAIHDHFPDNPIPVLLVTQTTRRRVEGNVKQALRKCEWS